MTNGRDRGFTADHPLRRHARRAADDSEEAYERGRASLVIDPLTGEVRYIPLVRRVISPFEADD